MRPTWMAHAAPLRLVKLELATTDAGLARGPARYTGPANSAEGTTLAPSWKHLQGTFLARQPAEGRNQPVPGRPLQNAQHTA